MTDTSKQAPQSGADVLARVRPQLRRVTVEICLRPDLVEEHAAAEEALAAQQLEDMKGQRLAKTGATKAAKDLAEKITALEAEMAASAMVRFVFEAMPKDKWRSLVDTCPPRKGNEIDQMLGYDRDSVEDAAVRACLVDPIFDDASWAEFIAVINPSEWGELRAGVRLANRSEADLPKSALASHILTRGARTSKRPAPGE